MNRLHGNSEVQSMMDYIKDLAYLNDTLFLELQEKFLLAILVEQESKRIRNEEDLLVILVALESRKSVEQFISKYSNTYPSICLFFQRVRTSASIISALREALLITFSQLSGMLKEISNEKENHKKAN